MFYKKGDGQHREVVLDDVMKERIWSECHCSAAGGHQARKKSVDKINSRFHFLGVTEFVNSRIWRCDACQHFGNIKTVVPELKPIKTSHPFEILELDLIGPFKATGNGNAYIMTLTCLFSKWVQAYSLPSKHAAEVSKPLTDFFYTFEPPKSIITDQGKESASQSLTNFRLGI